MRVSALAQWSFLTVLPLAAQGVLQRQLNETFPLIPEEDVVELAYSPDGARLAYCVRDGSGTLTLRSRAADGSGSSLELVTVSGQDLQPGPLRFLSDGVRILFTSREDGRTRLFTVPWDGSSAPLEPIGRAFVDFELTPDETRVVYRDDPFTANRFVLLSRPLAGGAMVTLNGPLVAGGDVDQFELSADGARAVYWAQETAGTGIYSALVDVAGSSVPLGTGVYQTPGFRLTPGRVVFRGQPSVRFELFSAPLDGSAPPIQISDPAGPSFVTVESDFEVSPDGAWAVYRSDRFSSFKYELFSVPVAGGMPPVRISPAMPAMSDVDRVFYLSPDSSRAVWRADALVDERLDLYSAPLDGSAPAVHLAAPATAEEDVNAVVLFDSSGTRAVFVSGWWNTVTEKLFSVRTDGSSAPVQLDDRVSTGQLYYWQRPELTLDGTRMVYRRNVGDGQQLRVARLDGVGAPLTLGGGEFLVRQRTSPDGVHVAFILDQNVDSVDELFTRPLDASTPALELGHGFAPAAQRGHVHSFRAGAQRVLWIADQDASGAIGLYSAPPRAPGQALRISDTSAGPIDVIPNGELEFAAGETRALYRGWLGEGEGLFSSTVDQVNDPIVLDAGAQPYASISSFRVALDGQSVVFLSDHDTDEVFELYRSSPTVAGAPVKLSGALVALGDVKPGFLITPDGGRVVYVADQATNELFELYSATGVGPPVKLSGLMPAGSDVWPELALSPDGSRVFYRANPGTGLELYSAPTDGSSAAVKISGPAILGASVATGFKVTPDGAHVLFTGTLASSTELRLYRADSDGANPPLPLSAPDFQVGGTLIDPAGTRVVYWAEHSSTFPQGIFSVPIAGGTPVELTLDVSGFGRVADLDQTVPPGFQITPDGTRVLFLFDPYTGVNGLHVVPIDGSAPSLRLNPETAGQDARGFLVDPQGESALYLTGFASGIDLFSVPLDLSTAEQRLTAEPSNGAAGADLGFMPDGTALYRFDRLADGQADLFAAFEGSRPFPASAATPTVFITRTR